MAPEMARYPRVNGEPVPAERLEARWRGKGRLAPHRVDQRSRVQNTL
jgi:hypothetical protein